MMPKDKYTKKYFLRYAFNNLALKHIKQNKLNHKGKQIKLILSTGKCYILLFETYRRNTYTKKVSNYKQFEQHN